MAGAGGKFFPKAGGEGQPLEKIEVPRGPGKDHFGNFIAAVRSRKPSDLNAEILEGHLSSSLCHLANISYRLGELVPFNPRTKAFGDDRDAYETLERMELHLEKGNRIPTADVLYRLGRRLAVDAQAETIQGDPEAARLLTREYRKPFEVPGKAV